MEKRKKLLLLVIAMVITALILTGCGGSGRGSEKDKDDEEKAAYMSAVENYEKMWNGDVKTLVKLIPPAALEKMAEDADEDVDDFKDMLVEEFEENYERGLSYYEDEYGIKVKIRYKVIDEKKITDKDLKDIQDDLKERYGIPKKSVTEGYTLDVEMSIKGKESDEYEDEGEVRAIKIDGKWYLFSESNDLLVTG